MIVSISDGGDNHVCAHHLFFDHAACRIIPNIFVPLHVYPHINGSAKFRIINRCHNGH